MSTPPVIPDHTLRRPIGRGAYGEVWLARNVMGAPRAVKIIWRRQFESDRPYEREFAGIQRYEPVSRSAEGLVHVLHVGRNNNEGYFYYVMELADSAVPMADMDTDVADGPVSTELTPLVAYAPRTLRSDMKRLSRLPVADCIRVALDVVGGLARLHGRGLVHRDVKPGNIIFVEGHAKLADIGLVSRENEGRTFVGTEGYIPPEGPGSPGADLYALGMALYEAATGYPPDQFPKAPREWFAEDAAPELLEFHAVVLKACEGAKERRYQSAEEMQADLALLQSGQSVRHLRALEERVATWRKIGWVAGVSVVLAVGTALFAHWRAKVAAESEAREIQLKEHAQRSLLRAEAAERESRRQLYSALLEQARASVHSGEMGQRVNTLDAVPTAVTLQGFRTNIAVLRHFQDTGADGTQPFSFRVPPLTNFLVLVSARFTNVICPDYTLELFGLPCPPPRLHIADDAVPGNVRLHWSTAYPQFNLEVASGLAVQSPGAFTNSNNARTIVSGRYTVTNSTVSPQHFFRLSK